MTPQQLIDWRARLKLNRNEAVRELGASRSAMERWEAGKSTIPRYIALAASAVAMGLPPWGQK